MTYHDFPHTIAQTKQRHQRELKALVHHALGAEGWRLRPAAERLGVTPSTLQGMIQRLGLSKLYAKNNPGRGRPARE